MTQCMHRNADPQSRRTSELEAEEVFTVAVVRAWVSAQRPADDCPPGWQDVFSMASLPVECATAFGTFMATIRRTMQRSLDIRCRRCPLVGADEEAMLRILGAIPAGDRLAAHEALSTWLATEGVMPAIDAAGRFMALLGAHGIELRYPPLLWPPVPASDRIGYCRTYH
jgi:hypothetical protein